MYILGFLDIGLHRYMEYLHMGKKDQRPILLTQINLTSSMDK